MSKKERQPLAEIVEGEELTDMASSPEKEAGTDNGERKDEDSSEDPTSPLIKAVQRGSSSTSLFFQERKLAELDVNATDNYHRNVFHYAISKPDTLKEILKQFETKIAVQKALHQADCDGETPMHRAAKIANTQSLEILYDHDNSLMKLETIGGKRSVLHFAVNSKSLHAVKFVLSKDPALLNCTDKNLQTPAHYAATLQQSSILEFLIAQGADTLKLDANKRLPIHVASSKGLQNNVELLLHEGPIVLDAVDNSAQSPLMLAAKNNFRHVVSFLLSKNADYKLKDKYGFTAFDLAVRRTSPEVVEVFLATSYWKQVLWSSFYGPEGTLAEIIKTMPTLGKVLLDKCVTTEGKKDHADYKITYDFFCLESRVQDNVGDSPQFEALDLMVETAHEACLRHPVAVKYVNVKWKRRGFKYNLASIVVTVIFHICLMLYTTRVIGAVTTHHERRRNQTETSRGELPTETVRKRAGRRPNADEMMVLRAIMLIIVMAAILREVAQIAIQRRRYFELSRYHLIFRVGTVIAVMVYLLPVTKRLTPNQLGFGAIAVLISWINLLQFLKVFPMIGIYIIVVQRVFWTLMKVIIVVLIYLLSFASTFYVLLAENGSFRNLYMSLASTFVAMLSGVDYENLFVARGWYPQIYELKIAVLVFFMLMMSIVVNNALIGLAVGDTSDVMNSAKSDKSVRMAKIVILLERSLNAIPRLKSVRDEILIEFPARKKTLYQQCSDMLFYDSAFDAVDAGAKEAEDEKEQEFSVEECVEKTMEEKLDDLRSSLRNELKEIQDQIGNDREVLQVKLDNILEKLK